MGFLIVCVLFLKEEFAMKLDSKVVMELGKSCMFSDEDIPKGGQPPKEYWADGHGIVHHLIFDKRKIEKHREEIKDLLKELPEAFFDKNGECFINMPFDKNKRQWGEQNHAEMLFSLGVAAGYIWFLPRELWAISYGVPMLGVDFELQKHRKEFKEKRKAEEARKAAESGKDAHTEN